MNWLRNAKSVGFKITRGYKYFVTSCEWRKLDLLWDYLSYSVCHCKHWKQWHSQHFLQRFKYLLDTWLLKHRLHLLNHCLLPPLSLPSLFSTWLSGSKLKQRLTEQLSDLNLTLRWSCFIIQGYNFSPQPDDNRQHFSKPSPISKVMVCWIKIVFANLKKFPLFITLFMDANDAISGLQYKLTD